MTFPYRKLSPFLLILMLWDSPIWAHGPISQVDSLKKVFEDAPQDSVKYVAAKAIMKLSFERDAEQGLRYSILSYDLAKEMDKKSSYAFHHNCLGLFLTSLGRYEEAVLAFEEGLEVTDWVEKEKSRLNFESSLYGNLGLAFGHLGKIEEEQEAYLKGLEIAEENGFEQQQAIFGNNLSKLYLDLANLEKAKIYIDKVIHIIKDIDYPPAKVLPYLNLGSYYLAKNEPDSAQKYIEIGLDYADDSGSLFDKGAALIQLSKHLTDQGKYESALDYSNRAIIVAQKLGNQELSILSELTMARVKRKMGDLKQADFCAARALNLLDEPIPLTELKIYEELEKIAVAKEAFGEAHEISLKIRTLKDTLLDINRQNYMANAESRMKMDKMKIEGLKKDQMLKQKDIQERTLILGFSLLALFLALMAAAFLFRNIRQKRRYHLKLENTVRVRTEKLREVNEDLEQANFELKRFNRIVSHDLKAPVNNIKALLELVEEETGVYGKESLNLQFIGRSSDQIMRLLEDVSLFYNFDEKQLKAEEFDMLEVMEEISFFLKSPIEKMKANFLFSNLPVIHSYWTPVFLTFKNLVENGIKYNESEYPEVKISYLREGEEHVFQVSDNGIGISPNHFDKVFEVFQRVSPAGKYDGSGLGLSISKKMIQEIGGEVLIKKSELNKGSLFEVRLPLRNASIKSKNQKASAAQ